MASAGAPPAARARTVRLFVDCAGERVLFAEAGEDAVAFLASLLAEPVRAAAEELLREGPPPAAAGCFGNLTSSLALLPGGAASSSSSLAPPLAEASPASASRAAGRAPAGMGIMSWRLFRCDHLGCRCSDTVSRAPGSACPCPSCGGGAATRDTELHFLEAAFYRRPDGSSAAAGRGAGRSGATFYRCRARDDRRGGRDVFPCRYRVTDERGVECPLCHGHTTVTVKRAANAKGGGEEAGLGRGGEPAGPTTYAVMDDFSVRPVAAGLGSAALLSVLGVADDPAAVRVVTVPFGYEEGLGMLWASLRSKTVLTDVFLPAAAGDHPRRC